MSYHEPQSVTIGNITITLSTGEFGNVPTVSISDDSEATEEHCPAQTTHYAIDTDDNSLTQICACASLSDFDCSCGVFYD